MIRENRYLVLKREDIKKYLSDEQRQNLEEIDNAIAWGRDSDDKPNTKYVVVGSDWPMYEQTWKAIEEWVDSLPVNSKNFPQRTDIDDRGGV